MKATVITLLVIALLLALLSGVGARVTREASQFFWQSAGKMEEWALRGDWQRLDQEMQIFSTGWEKAQKQLKLLVSHQDTDDVTLALGRLRAGMLLQDSSLAMEALAELKEACLHLYHRDALALTNLI